MVDMFQKALAATIARELRIATTTAEQTHRRLWRLSESAARARAPILAASMPGYRRTITALLMSELPIEAPAALDRASGLCLVDDRGRELVATLELTLTELMDQGHLGDVIDFRLTVGPWPIGAIEMTFADGSDAWSSSTIVTRSALMPS